MAAPSNIDGAPAMALLLAESQVIPHDDLSPSSVFDFMTTLTFDEIRSNQPSADAIAGSILVGWSIDAELDGRLSEAGITSPRYFLIRRYD
jgi:hypothetical protein